MLRKARKIPEGESELCVLHEGGNSHVKRRAASQRGPGEQNVAVLQQEGQVVEHGLLVLARRSAEVAQEPAASHHHLVGCVLKI